MIIIDRFFHDLGSARTKLRPYWDNDSGHLWLHLTTFYRHWAELFPSKPFDRTALLNEIRQQPYFVDDNQSRKLLGKPVRSLVLDLKLLPKNIKDFFGRCSCSTQLLMCRGSQCGGI